MSRLRPLESPTTLDSVPERLVTPILYVPAGHYILILLSVGVNLISMSCSNPLRLYGLYTVRMVVGAEVSPNRRRSVSVTAMMPMLSSSTRLGEIDASATWVPEIEPVPVEQLVGDRSADRRRSSNGTSAN